MDAKDKKRDIIQTLQSTNDEQLIEEVYELLYPNEAIENVSIESLPEELQSKIKQALDDYKSGRYITNQQMKQKLEQWLTN
jgi:ribosome-binding protein aMBF1 (putative translation factor)